MLGIMTLFIIYSCNSSQDIFKENKEGWDIFGDANWNFSKKELVGKISEGTGFVMTQNTYKSFILELEFRPDSTINSGVFVRCKNKEITPIDCYEFNIWDLNPNQDYRTGSIVRMAGPLAYVETIDKWNKYKIKVEKNHIQVWINNVLTVDVKDEKHLEGYIGLQASGRGAVSFRKVRITDLNKN